MKVAFLSSPYGTPRYRCHHPCEQLASQGVEAAVLEGEAPSFAGFTHVVLNRVPMTPALETAIAAAEREGAVVLFDVDDLIHDAAVLASMGFVIARSPTDRERLMDAAAAIARTVERCGAGLCPTAALRADLEARGHRARVTLNGPSDEIVRLSAQAADERARDADVVRIGFPAGHPGHTFNLAIAEDALATLLERYPHLRLVFMGYAGVSPRLSAWSDRIEVFTYLDWRRLPFELARLDVCIAPLEANRFNGCKSDIKFLEAALVRVPVVASPVGQLGESIRDGVNGLLADSTDGWVDALSSLIEDPRKRADLGAAAHDEVLRERTSAALGPSLRGALEASVRR